MLIKQVPNHLHALQDDNLRVSEILKLELDRPPLIVHFVELRFELALLRGNRTYLDNFIDDLHHTDVFQLLQGLSQRIFDQNVVILLNDVEMHYLEVRILQRVKHGHEWLQLQIQLAKFLADLSGERMLLEVLHL